jgi:hypothetical protein
LGGRGPRSLPKRLPFRAAMRSFLIRRRCYHVKRRTVLKLEASTIISRFGCAEAESKTSALFRKFSRARLAHGSRTAWRRVSLVPP